MSSIGRFRWLVLLVAGLGTLPGCGNSDPVYKKNSRAQAELFLTSLKNNDGKAAYSLLGNDFQSRLSAEEKQEKSLKLSTWTVGSQPISGWNIQEEHFNGAAHFKGMIHGKDAKGADKDYSFEIKLGDSPDWKVSFFTSEVTGK